MCAQRLLPSLALVLALAVVSCAGDSRGVCRDPTDSLPTTASRYATNSTADELYQRWHSQIANTNPVTDETKPSFEVKVNIGFEDMRRNNEIIGVEFAFDYDADASPYEQLHDRASKFCIDIGKIEPEACAIPLVKSAESTWLRLLLPQWQAHLSSSGIAFTRNFFNNGAGGFYK